MANWGTRTSRALTALTLETYGDTCHLCGRPGATTADHKTPRSKGGTNDLANLRPAHHTCNSARGDMPIEEWRTRYPIRKAKANPSRRW